MKVLITGGAGFIGSHTAAFLAEKGVEVCVFDSLVSGVRGRVPAAASFILGDIRDQNALLSAMRGVTHVVHLAAQVSVSESIANPDLTHEVNIIGTQNVLEATRHAGAARFVYASSAAVYGDRPELPKTEKSPLQPKSPYAESKIANENDARVSGLSAVGLRFFNVYGPGQAGNHPYASVIPRWIEAVRAGKAITVYGDGSQTRDFIHIRDVVNAIYQALTADATGVFNIASGKETSLNELQEMIVKVHEAPLEVMREAPRKGDILRSVADISLAGRVLHFQPSVPLAEGVAELIRV